MKQCKLSVHKATANKNEVMISQKEFPDVSAGDVLEIYHPEDEWTRLLLQVKAQPEDHQQKDALSVEQGIASIFSLRSYQDVLVNKVNPKDVSLDLVELLFKDQYFGRSDMWRLCKTLTNTCVYLKKPINFAEMRTHVNELWSRGENVTCGVITEDTRIVFRSSTAVVQIFIQMSSEMWDFDLHGDLYFEKAVNGFLTDLFERWKDQNCNHDVTIVLFSRTFYDAHSIEEFPPSVRECLQMDSNGRIYEDFYKVIVQNERYDDWKSTLRQLRILFNTYLDTTLHYHEKCQQGWPIPTARNSLASEGNFLETLNMSLNLFENYYLDRNFDRTGKVSVVITPGPGVFEVDRQLANITKQRTIDCGVGSDLVCMGEQPLHAVPLFIFQSKNSHSSIEVGDDYSIPHWMNHSFYMSEIQIEQHSSSSFVPRIKPPPGLLKELEEGPKTEHKDPLPRKEEINDENIPFMNYDEYDAQVFKQPHGTQPRSLSVRCINTNAMPKTLAEARLRYKPRTRHLSDDWSAYMGDYKEPKKNPSQAISIPSKGSHDDISFSFGAYPPIPEKSLSRGSCESSESDELVIQRPVVGSAGSPVGHSRNLYNYRPHHALINPFAPSRLQFKMTSNRRRWVHAFPVDQKGQAMQARHVHSIEPNEEEPNLPLSQSVVTSSKNKRARVAAQSATQYQAWASHGASSVEADVGDHSASGDSTTDSQTSRSEKSSHTSLNLKRFPQAFPQRHQSWMKNFQKNKPMFGSTKTSEQAWSPDMNTDTADPLLEKIAVDWKSLTIPASLPVTTDYFPDNRSLQRDYIVADYDLLAEEDMNAELLLSWNRTLNVDDRNLSVYRKSPLTKHEAFMELVCQRVGQGFQLISKKKHRSSHDVTHGGQAGGMSTTPTLKRYGPKETLIYHMSIGRTYHILKLHDRNISVTRYSPRHPQPQLNYEYRYRFQAPDSFSQDVSWTNFCNEMLEKYKWNHLDQYICTQGDWDFGLIESLKYWRSRFLLLPNNNPSTKKIIDKETTRCDIYEEKSPAELNSQTQGFIRFLESLNKLKRSHQQRKVKVDVTTSSGPGPEVRKSGGNGTQDEKLHSLSPAAKIIESLTDAQSGLSFLQNQAGLPMNTFISMEAATWCINNLSDVHTVNEAVNLLQRLMDEGSVLHASGDIKHRFIYGFYLYYIPQSALWKPGMKRRHSVQGATSENISHPTSHLTSPGANHNALFQNEWCEVSVLPIHNTDADSGTPEEEDESTNKFYLSKDRPRKRSDSMLLPEVEDWRKLSNHMTQSWGQQLGCSEINHQYQATLLHKYVNVDVDPNNKSERKELAMARYHAYYSPKCAFELQIQWMVATGCILGDLIYTYAIKASTSGFHLIPVPCDPFALPYTENSDPLRGPIFVPLDMRAFDSNLFDGCTDEQRQDALYVIQDAIVKRFGFMPVSVKVPPLPGQPSDANDNHQYVHCTTGMFILIPESNAQAPQPLPPVSSLGVSPQRTPGMMKKSSSDLHQLYIARQGRPESAPNQVGFLWSWNYMSSRRWRSANTGDENFQDLMLADFRRFCANSENRLENFWQNFKHNLDIPL